MLETLLPKHEYPACPETGIIVVTSKLQRSLDCDTGKLLWCGVSGTPIVGGVGWKDMDYV